MNKDFIQSLKHKGFTARIKRLSDSLFYDSKKYYSNSEFDIEPNWHLIFLLLKNEKQLTVTEIAKRLHFSHPAVIKITKKMMDKGYLDSSPDKSDKRKSQLQLSKKAKKHLPSFEEEWNRHEYIISKVVDEEFLFKLSKIEEKLRSQSISERYLEKHHNKKH